VIVPALSLFSFSVVAGAAGFGSKPNVGSAASAVVPRGGGEGTFVVVAAKPSDNGVANQLQNGANEVCWISKSQLARVSAVYGTSTTSLSVGARTYSLVTVDGANDHDLRQLLGAPAVQCRLVHVAHLFFLPFDPNLS
jgi:hypothetical protein